MIKTLILHKQMKIFSIIILLVFSFAGSAHAYPQSQMEDCISSASSNPATKSISKILISNYCDCALKAIIDNEQDIRESGYQCALKTFN